MEKEYYCSYYVALKAFCSKQILTRSFSGPNAYESLVHSFHFSYWVSFIVNIIHQLTTNRPGRIQVRRLPHADHHHLDGNPGPEPLLQGILLAGLCSSIS